MHRPALGEFGGERGGGVGIVRAVEPGFDPSGERPVGEPLETRRPCRGGEAGAKLGVGYRERGLGGEHLPREVGVADLVHAGERRDKGRVELPVAGFEQELGADRGRGLPDRTFRLRRLGQADQRHAPPRNGGFLRGDLGQGVAEEMLVVDPDAGDPADDGDDDDVGRVEPAAEPDLEHHRVGGRIGEGEHGRRGVDLEQAAADRVIGVEHAGHDIG